MCVHIWVAGNVAGFAQKNMVAHVAADLLLDSFCGFVCRVVCTLVCKPICTLVCTPVC